MALNQPQMKNGPVLLSPTPSNAGSWFGRRHAATECEVDLALMAKSDEWAQTLDAEQDSIGPVTSALRHAPDGCFRPGETFTRGMWSGSNRGLLLASAGQIHEWLGRWQLVPDGEGISTHSSVLMPVRRDGAPAMLKIATVEDEVRGANLMVWYAADGAARVLAHEGPALLLERLGGEQALAEMERVGRGDQATRIICAVVAKLHDEREQSPPATLVSLPTWFRPLELAGTRHGGVLAKSAKAARELLAAPQDVVPLHGDIHHGNILDGGERGWLVIDPKGLFGERGFDYANLFCHPDAMVAEVAGRLQHRVELVSKEADLSPKRLLKWILAYAGLKSVWSMDAGRHDAPELLIAPMAAAALGA